MSSTTIDAHRLTSTAFGILQSDLESHGNELSDLHKDALWEVLECFTSYAIGQATGRKAFPLATGLGKTSSIVAFIAALDLLDYRVPVAVSASKVDALTSLHRDLIAKGVRRDLIGIKHSLTGPEYEPSTGNADRLYQLVTHARVRSGNDLELFGNHEGKPRALMIYDETLLRSDSLAVDETMLRSALGAMAPHLERRKGTALALAHAYLCECRDLIRAALDSVRDAAEISAAGVAVEMPYREVAELEGYSAAVGSAGLPMSYVDTLRDLLEISKDTCRVLSTSQGGGVVWSSESVPAALGNVVVLDASQPVRQLATLDPTIETAGSFGTSVKSFRAVEIHQVLSGGGRSTIESTYAAISREKSAVSKEIIDIVKERWELEAGFLIFTFKKKAIDISGTLQRDMQHAGIDLDAVTTDGKPKVTFLTWGSETALNGLEGNTAVILAGCVQRSMLDVAAAIQGQTQDYKAALPNRLIKGVLEAEIAHSIYQAASRGSCRRVTLGEAHPMRLYFIHRNVGMRSLLEKVMPHAQWHYRRSSHLTKGQVDGVVADLTVKLLAYLRGLPESITKVSSVATKAAMLLKAGDSAQESAFSRAAKLVNDESHCGWTVQGRSFVRWSEVFASN